MPEEKKENGRSSLQQKQINSATLIHCEPGTIDKAEFQHTVLCQTCLPYSNPGEAPIWKRNQGSVSLAVQTTKIFNPVTKDYDFVGLPYGPKARLLLSHFNTEAIKTQSKDIHVKDSMTSFIKSMGFDTNGRTVKSVKDQLRRLSTSIISLGYTEDGKTGVQVNLQIVKGFDLPPDNIYQKSLWPGYIRLTDDYFNSLLNHAIPLDQRALRALANNAMALDIYAWLTQRLHRIPISRPQFIAWAVMWEQFGSSYVRIDKFKMVFRHTLSIVKLQYLDARIEEVKNRGFNLYSSPPPITRTSISLTGIDVLK